MNLCLTALRMANGRAANKIKNCDDKACGHWNSLREVHHVGPGCCDSMVRPEVDMRPIETERRASALHEQHARCKITLPMAGSSRVRGWLFLLLIVHVLVHPMVHGFCGSASPAHVAVTTPGRDAGAF